MRRLCSVIAIALVSLGCPRPRAAEPAAIELSPSNGVIQRGGSLDFVATGLFDTGQVREVTGEVVWQVEDGFVATLDADVPGRVIGKEVGTTRVRATLGAATKTMQFSVVGGTVVRLEVTPAQPVLPVGLSLQLQVHAVRADDSVSDVTAQAFYSVMGGSASASVRDETPGVVVGMAPGTSEVLVSFDGVSVQVPVEVTTATVRQVTLSPANLMVPLGTSLPVRATASLSDGRALDVSEQVQWSSSASSVAFVSLLVGEKGLVTGRALGTATLRATLGAIEATSTVTVTSATLERVEVSPNPLSLAKGTQATLSAQAIFTDGTRQDVSATATWASESSMVASVSSAGVVRGLEVGTTNVSVTYQARTGSVAITVSAAELVALELSPSTLQLAAGTSSQLAAMGRFSDGSVQDLTEQALWTTTDATVAAASNGVGQRGLVTGLRPGGTELVASMGARVGRMPVTVTAARLASITLSPAQVTLPLGSSVDVVATGVFTDGSTQALSAQVSWTSASPGVAAVDPVGVPGRVSAVAVGTAQIHAALQGVSASLAVEVTPETLTRLELTPQQLSLARGTTVQLTATGVYSNASRRDLTALVTFRVDNGAIASVSNAVGSEGLLRAVSLGQTLVRASFQGVEPAVQLTVTAAALQTLTASQTSLVLPVGFESRLTVTGLYSDGSSQDLTAQATWASSAPTVASASNGGGAQGTVRGLSAGTSTVTANVGAVTTSISVSVTPAVLTSLALTPPLSSMPRGTTQVFVATATYSDGSTRDVSTQATWSSTGPALSVSSGLVSALQLGQAEVVARIGSIDARVSLTVTAAVLTGLDVTPSMPSAPVGVQVSLVATGTYSDGSTQNVSSQVTWTSASPLVATVSNASGTQGRVSATSVGSSVVTAALPGHQASVTFTVQAAALSSIEVTPQTARIANGTFASFQATGRYTDGATADLSSQVVWTVSDTALASVSNAAPTMGRVQALQAGVVEVRATRQSVTGTATLTIHGLPLTTLTIAPSAPSVAAGLTQQLSAVGTFSDLSTQDLSGLVTWASSDASRVTVSNAAASLGEARAVAVGTSTVSATALGQTGTVTFTVTSALLTALEVTPVATSIARGLTQDFVATGRFSDGSSADVTTQVTWSSSTPAIATVSNASGSHGRVSALTVGTTQVSASLSGQTVSSTVSVTPATLQQLQVTPASSSIPRGLSQQLSVTGVYSDGSSTDLTGQVVYSSSATAVASVSNASGSRGFVVGQSLGSAVITVAQGSVSATAMVTVTAAVLQQVQVSPAAPSVPRGLTRQLVATGVFSDGSTQDLSAVATWQSADVDVATVSQASGSEGMVQAIDQGVVTISATHLGRTGSVQVTVTPAVLQVVQVNPVMPSVAAGLEVPLSATGVYSDSTTQDLTSQVTWTTSDPVVAVVSNGSGTEGVVTGRDVGAATVTATLSGISGSTTVTVTPSVLQQLQVTPANPSRPKGLEVQLTATGVFSDGSTQDLTSQVTWNSSDSAVVPVSNASGSVGRAVAQNVGSAVVSASYGGVTGSTPFTVTAAQLTQVDVTPMTVTLPLGTVRQFVATGRYTDNSTQNLTAQATWASSNTSVLDVSNATSSEGLATTIAIGSAQVTMTFSTFTATASVTITQAALAAIELTPAAGTTPLGFTRQFIAIGQYTDGTTQVLTTQATWSSSDTSKAFISNAVSSRGLLSTVAVGSVVIEATFGGVTGSAPHSISSATLVSLSITPASLTLAASATTGAVATGHYSDGSSQTLTSTVTWSSSAPAIAQVSNASGSEGLVSGIAAGSATLTAQVGSVSQSVPVTVTP